jgi:hypothetical protein
LVAGTQFHVVTLKLEPTTEFEFESLLIATAHVVVVVVKADVVVVVTVVE